MSNTSDLHTLNWYFHNVMSLVRYMKEDNVDIEDDLQKMLDLALEKEEEITDIIEKLKTKDMK